MATKRSSPLLPLVGIVVLAIAALAGLNYFNGKSSDPTPEPTPAASSAAGTSPDAPTFPQAEGANELAGVGADATVGDDKSKNEIVIGWKWTPEVQREPSRVWQAIEDLQKMKVPAHVRIVNLDAAPDSRAEPGISVNGKLVIPAQPDGTIPGGQSMVAVGRAIGGG